MLFLNRISTIESLSYLKSSDGKTLLRCDLWCMRYSNTILVYFFNFLCRKLCMRALDFALACWGGFIFTITSWFTIAGFVTWLALQDWVVRLVFNSPPLLHPPYLGHDLGFGAPVALVPASCTILNTQYTHLHNRLCDPLLRITFSKKNPLQAVKRVILVLGTRIFTTYKSGTA